MFPIFCSLFLRPLLLVFVVDFFTLLLFCHTSLFHQYTSWFSLPFWKSLVSSFNGVCCWFFLPRSIQFSIIFFNLSLNSFIFRVLFSILWRLRCPFFCRYSWFCIELLGTIPVFLIQAHFILLPPLPTPVLSSFVDLHSPNFAVKLSPSPPQFFWCVFWYPVPVRSQVPLGRNLEQHLKLHVKSLKQLFVLDDAKLAEWRRETLLSCWATACNPSRIWL